MDPEFFDPSIPDTKIRIPAEHAESFLRELRNNFLGFYKYSNSLMRIRDLFDPRSGIRNTDQKYLENRKLAGVRQSLQLTGTNGWSLLSGHELKPRMGILFMSEIDYMRWGKYYIFLPNRHRYGTKDGGRKYQKKYVPVLRIRIWLQAFKWFRIQI